MCARACSVFGVRCVECMHVYLVCVRVHVSMVQVRCAATKRKEEVAAVLAHASAHSSLSDQAPALLIAGDFNQATPFLAVFLFESHLSSCCL